MAAGASPLRSEAVTPASGDLIELDVVALDRQDLPVSDLRQEDFQIKEDGRVVDIKTFAHVTALGTMQSDDARSVTLLMDDVGVPMAGTSPMRAIAQVMLSPAGRGDDISVVRLSSHSDEAFGDRMTARDRIDGYRGGVVPFSIRETPETVLKVIAKMSRQLETDRASAQRDHLPWSARRLRRRRAGARNGSSPCCGPPWVAAISAAARANVSVYSVDPTGLSRNGRAFVGWVWSEADGRRALLQLEQLRARADVIWGEASRYYLLGYWPAASKRDLHSIDVNVARKGVHVRARKRR